MGSRYQSQTALFGPKTLINCVTASSPLSLGPKSAQKGLEKQGRLRGFVLHTEVGLGPGAGLVRAWCGPDAGLVRACCKERAPLQREVEVLVNFAEGAQTVSSFKFAGRPRGCCAGVRLRSCRFSLFEKLLTSLLRYVGKKQTCPVTNSTPTWRLRYLARQARS